MMQERGEKGLLHRVREGDSQGFLCLYERYGRDVLGILLRLTRGDRAEAEDLTQETFLAAFQGRKAFSGRVPLRAWLVGIAVRRWRDGERRPRPKTIAIELEPASTTQLENQVAARALLGAALVRLPDDQQSAVLLVLAQGLTYREAAEALGVPEGTVKWRVSEASKRLRATLSEDETHV